jgi:hypothetical protein
MRTNHYRILGLIILWCALTVFACSQNATLSEPKHLADPTGTSSSLCKPEILPPQGLYESCLPMESGCLERLKDMGSKGFRIVLNDGLRYANTADSLIAYANLADQLGMRVILPIKYSAEWDTDHTFLVRNFPSLSQECNCSNNREFLTYYVNTLKDHPALWGYYIADEVHPEYHGGLKIYSDMIKSLDPDHPRLIVEEGSNDPMEIFFTFPSFMKDTTDILATDYYPYGYIDTYKDISRYTSESARNTQYWAEKLNLKSSMVLQAYAMPQYYDLTQPLCMLWPACAPFPSYEQMKAQRDQALQYSEPEILLWFSYPDILRSVNAQQHWSDLTAAAFSPPPCALKNPTSQQQSCPTDWNCEDIGNPRLAGGQIFSNAKWTVEGAGWDINSTLLEKADQFHFVWKNMNGNGEFSTRILSQTNNKNSAKAGIMLRSTFDPVSPYYAALVTSRSELIIRYRFDFNENPIDLLSLHVELPVYLKVSRSGSSFRAYLSKDGESWALIPDSIINLPNLKDVLMAGIAVTSQNESLTNKAEFDRVYLNSANP